METIEIDIVSESELVERCIADERHYHEMLYRKYADKMYNICLTYSKDDDDACDVLQEGFIRVFRNLHRFRFECPLEAWIRKIMVNIALEIYRKKQREREVMEEVMIESEGIFSSIAEDILSTINAKELMNMVNELPIKAAMVLKLYAIEGYSHKEIAELMATSVGTSKSQLNRARTLLQASITKSQLQIMNG